jgi:type II secretory pathway component PulJ
MQLSLPELLIALLLLGPLALLAWALLRRGRRIERELLDKQERTRRIEQISPGIVRFVLERDGHTCQTCGSRRHVGVDFAGDTPEEDSGVHIQPDMLEARCADCYAARWPSLAQGPVSGRDRD